MTTTKCKTCGKKINIDDWVSSIQFIVNGILNGEKEDIEIIEEDDLCRNCFNSLKSLIYLISEERATLEELINLMRLKGEKNK